MTPAVLAVVVIILCCFDFCITGKNVLIVKNTPKTLTSNVTCQFFILPCVIEGTGSITPAFANKAETRFLLPKYFGNRSTILFKSDSFVTCVKRNVWISGVLVSVFVFYIYIYIYIYIYTL